MAGSVQVRPFYLSPSILSANPVAMKESIDALEGNFDWIHFDVMDGHFVPNLTFGPSLLKAMRKTYPDSFLDAHLMVTPTEDFLEMFLSAGPSQLIIHQESTLHIHRALCQIRDAGVKPGVVINPGTPVQMLDPILHLVDCVLLMSVNPGFGGQSFIPETLQKSRYLVDFREREGLDFDIEMDGGISPKNLREVLEAGVNAVVMGSAIFSAPDPLAVAKQSKQIAQEVRLNG